MRIDHITLLVTSLDASMRYYDTLLPLIGFTKQRDHVWTDGDGFYLQFNEARPGTSPYERYGAGMNHVGFAARSADEVASIRTAMQQAGFEVPDLQHFGDVTALFMRDPDGIRFEVTYFPPGVAPVD
ncbi:VOC family protein [Lysobacter korlensis]|uniref:VOC family protein n=1 Tax=Lysobacter korlensis TaxID=553636 RepID=A0ABV6RJW4_9GAMM